MLCCLNPNCDNPFTTDDTKFCPNCGVPLIVLRNRYRPIKPLGGGGFGKTYLAEDIDKLGKKTVIKQFAPQVQGTSARQKAKELFEQEARRLELLGEHPQIPGLLAYFQEDSHLYLVQQFIDGQNLFQHLQHQGTFSEGKIRNLLLELLDILKIVHEHKVIHRDIKPENIIRRSDGKIVLIDFGASKQLTKTVMTAQGTTIGSLGYAPLEQMQGGEAYGASDLYSLGATCFHLLSGIHPWELWKSQGYGWVGSWRQHVKQSVSQELGQILDRLLQEDYQQRYQSAQEVLQALNSAPSPPKPVSATQLSQPLQYRIPHLWAIPLIVLIGAGIISLPKLRENSEFYTRQGIEKFEKADFKSAVEDYNQAIKLNREYADAYKQRGLARNYLNYKQGSKEDLREAEKLFNAQGHQGDAKRTQGLLKYFSKNYDEAIAAYTEAIDLNPDDFKAYIYRGDARSALGKKEEAIEDYSKAIEINPEYALAYKNRGDVRETLEEYQKAIEDYNKAIEINPDYVIAYNNRGFARNKLEEYQKAIEDYNKAIEINPEYALAYKNRGDVRETLEEYQKAIEDYTKAIEINPEYALAYYNRGYVHAELKNYQKAIEDYTQAIKNNPGDAIDYKQRGDAHYKLNNYQKAIEDYNKAIEINPDYATAYYNRGITRSNLGDKQAAIGDFRKAANLYKQQGKESDYQNALNSIKQLEG